MKRWCWLLLVVIAPLPWLQGCGLSYSAQAVTGHLNMISGSRSVDKLIADPSRPAELKEPLQLARDIRQFASEELALPDNASYRSYVNTGREFASWAVFAAPEFSLSVRTWCFPVVGCVPYRGYFSEAAANRFAASVRDEGLDVHVTGVPAYSTLGWFSDPLLNTMFGRGETYLSALVFHELSHQQVYARDDSAFNEAYAVAVEETGVIKWLRHRNDSAGLRSYDAARGRYQEFLALIADSREELQRIYASDATDAKKRAAKAATIETLRARYKRLRNGKWRGFRGYDRWFDTPINNAKLAAVAVYSDLVPAFKRLLEICSGDYARFHNAVARFAAIGGERRGQALRDARTCE